ncbi:MAG TPA: hypothetical protein VGJ20_22600 [Xanthobacteraceae bacterium]
MRCGSHGAGDEEHDGRLGGEAPIAAAAQIVGAPARGRRNDIGAIELPA